MANHRFLNALQRKPVDKTPIWVMRQAGRYLPEYRKVREKAGDFLTLCKTPELACEVTLQPLRRFDLDASIIFSDILTIPDAMGLGLHFIEGEGPKFTYPLKNKTDIENLAVPDMSDLNYVSEAIKLTKREINNKVPLIGFSGSPWTLACYMVEGGSSKTFNQIRALPYQDPETLTLLLKKLETSVTDYLSLQIEAGADALMLFDTWGGLLTPANYELFSLRFTANIIEKIRKKHETPIILFTKQGGHWLERMADSGCNALGLDWTINIKHARERVGDRVALQGNLDPALLLGTPNNIRQTVKQLLQDYGQGTGHIANLGHGIDQQTPIENVKTLVDAIHEFSVPYHTL